MSAPIEQLGKLSIGRSMPATTRSRPHGQEPAVARSIEDSSDSDSEEETSSSDSEDDDSQSEATIRGGSSITYDIRMLSRSSKNRAISGLTGGFLVDKCRPVRGGGIDFQVADHGEVHISDNPMTCSCRDFQETNVACRHIFWLVDQLHPWVLPGRPSPGVPLTDEGECSKFAPMLDMIGGNMEGIAKKVNWPYTPTPGSPAGSTSECPASMTRPDKARDILSAFDQTTMPDEFRPDLVETINQPRTPEQCVVQGDFEATMFRLAVHDENVYSSLRKVMPAGARAAIFFDKIQRKSRTLLADFDRYCQTGIRRRDDGVALEIGIVIEELQKNVKQIQDNISSRSPHGSKGAAEALIDLLRSISCRNYDAFENQTWGRLNRAGEAPHDRNLYLQLIGQQSTESEELFVLDNLETLPNEIIRQWVPQLATIFEDIQTNGAPAKFLRKLQSLMAGENPPEAANVGATASGHKRPAAGSSVSRKRTK